MTKKLEETFNLAEPDIEEIVEQSKDIDLTDEKQEVLEHADQILDKIDEALPMVTELDEAGDDLDELSALAKDSFKDLMDLGMGLEPKLSKEIFQAASNLLGHAITAKNAKIEKKLRMIDLQIKKRRLDQNKNNENPIEPTDISGEARVMNRNELLTDILAHIKENSKDS